MDEELQPPDIFKTYKADFEMMYIDRGSRHVGVIKILLYHDAGERGYRVSGNSEDADGHAWITRVTCPTQALRGGLRKRFREPTGA